MRSYWSAYCCHRARQTGGQRNALIVVSGVKTGSASGGGSMAGPAAKEDNGRLPMAGCGGGDGVGAATTGVAGQA